MKNNERAGHQKRTPVAAGQNHNHKPKLVSRSYVGTRTKGTRFTFRRRGAKRG